MTRPVDRLLTPILRRAGRAYLAGSERPSALAVAGRLLALGSMVSIAYWNAPVEPPAAVLAENAAALDALAAWGRRARLAIKVPALGRDCGAVRELASRAAESGVRLDFDAHAPADADVTLELAGAARAQGARVAVALPARWARSLDDVARAADGDLGVRVVKGQWPEEGGRHLVGDRELRAAYLRLVERLSGTDVPFALATHDPVLLGRALELTGRSSAPAAVELLPGLPLRRPLAVSARAGARVDFYVPYGSPSLGYPVSSVLSRPRLAAAFGQGLLRGSRNQSIQLGELPG
ncbi:L-proline dehydrogenase [Blastococcus aggregatus]|uniref:L-proline dehydrogenase n=1 Tax=Blastococcus aggregatus TaxID=38502 RepID=A0A285V1C8_9ACTN|nr:hypothetical protein [Blastococcus aggregatus]SOC47727.1 L-proline dehydrogenase [Blastococcus aggregatus]